EPVRTVTWRALRSAWTKPEGIGKATPAICRFKCSSGGFILSPIRADIVQIGMKQDEAKPDHAGARPGLL
ncbi:MAG: hypothetical protein DME23_25955, partial [Verrucomicrobia bacterium]